MTASLLELRKEKSRDAARSRRGKENYEFYELAKLLPLPAAITSQLDKASIIKLTISYLKLRHFSAHGDPSWISEGISDVSKCSSGHSSRMDTLDPFESRQGTHILQALDGFAFILGNDGRFLYISETVSIYLGLSQVEMSGSSIFDYVHSEDHLELAEQLGMCLMPIGQCGSLHSSCSDEGSSPTTPRPGSPPEKGYIMVQSPGRSSHHKSFCIRMKSTLTKRGVHVKTLGYRVVHIIGSVRPISVSSVSGSGDESNNPSPGPAAPLGFTGTALALPPPTVTELRLEVDTFITKLSPDFKVIYCEPKISDLMDLEAGDVTDKLLYDLCHVEDLKKLRHSHSDILNKGQVHTDCYRLLNRHGGYVWVQTCATTLLNSKNQEDLNIIAINFVVSGNECKRSIEDLWQVLGDFGVSISSTSRTPSCEETLKEINKNKSSVITFSGSSCHSGFCSDNKSQSCSPKRSNENSKTPAERNKANMKCLRDPLKLVDDDNDDNMEAPSPEKMLDNTDNKNSRRKKEIPRKRKRSSNKCGDDVGNKTVKVIQASTSPDINHINPAKKYTGHSMEDSRALSVAYRSVTLDRFQPQSPEDLSVKSSKRISPDVNTTKDSSSLYQSNESPFSSSEVIPSMVVLTSADHDSPSPLSMTRSTVKELEAAMNRHLPLSDPALHRNKRISSYSLSSLSEFARKSSIHSNIKSSTAAQSYFPPHSHSSKVPGFDTDKSTSILQSACNRRESVIKSSSRHVPAFSNLEPPTSLLTPPEPDPSTYKDYNNPYVYCKSDSSTHSQFLEPNVALNSTASFYKDPCAYIPYKDHTPSTITDHISAYKNRFSHSYKEPSAYTDAIQSFTVPSLMSPSSRINQAYQSFHHHHHHLLVPNTTSSVFTCSMTPPSSNSPDVTSIKHTATTQPFDPALYSSEVNAICSLSQKQALLDNTSHLSLQPALMNQNYYYCLPKHHSNFHCGVNDADPAKESYNGLSFPGTGSMYMDLNQASQTQKQLDTRSRHLLPWY